MTLGTATRHTPLATAELPDSKKALERIRSLVDEWDVQEEELADVSAAVERQRAAARKIVVNQLRQLVEFWEITEQELKRPLQVGQACRSAPVRYRHPISGETWSGEGRQPDWLKTALVKEGYRVEELRR